MLNGAINSRQNAHCRSLKGLITYNFTTCMQPYNNYVHINQIYRNE